MCVYVFYASNGNSLQIGRVAQLQRAHCSMKAAGRSVRRRAGIVKVATISVSFRSIELLRKVQRRDGRVVRKAYWADYTPFLFNREERWEQKCGTRG